MTQGAADAERFAELASTVSAAGPIAYRFGTSDEEPVLTPERILAVGVARPDDPEWREVAVGVPRDTEPFPRKLEGRPLFREIGLHLTRRVVDRLRKPIEWWSAPGELLTRDGPTDEWLDMTGPAGRRPGEPRHENDHLWPLDLLAAPPGALSDARTERHGTEVVLEAQLDLKPMTGVLTGLAAKHAKRVQSAVGPLRVTLDAAGRPVEIAVSNPALVGARWTIFAFEPSDQPPAQADVWARWRRHAGG